ncbi:MAG TPA: AAA family ATPase [Bacteroidetes bacterium]|nr:AAA family ATPase [Bacteroidota bacterium]
MAKKRILKGDSNFKRLVANNGYFVDKTLLVKEFFDNGDMVLLMPRPRRFGKTLNLSMVEHFFDINKKESAELFSEYKISAEKEFCEQHQNRYPVINISLKSIRAENWEGCIENIKTEISDLYIEHDYLLESKNLRESEKRKFEKIIDETAKDKDYYYSLKHLSRYLKNHFGQPVIILVDEYDTPIIDGYTKKYYSQIITFMQVFMGTAFKGNDNLKKGLITGILRIARESIFSEMNNVGVYTITSLFFSDKFGFTEQETKDALQCFDLSDKFKSVQQWYNGYQFGNTKHIYNPWSIVNYLSRHEEGFKPYWINTGTDSLIKERILNPGDTENYDTLQKLISGQTIEKVLDENFVFSDFDTDKELLWTLLTFSGYLTQTKNIGADSYELKIPNYEITKVFKDIVVKWLNINIKVKRELLVSATQHLVNNRIPEFEKGFKKIMGDTFSYFDTAGGNAENVYQAYVLGMLAIIGDDYIIKSNRESGEGRYDILLIPYDKNRYGIVIEIKQIKRDKKETDGNFYNKINGQISEALNQIERNKYYKELLTHKIKNIIKLPIVFAGKEPFVMQLPENKLETF